MAAAGSGIGAAWLALADELEAKLRESDPGARVRATVGPTGLLELELSRSARRRTEALALAREYEERARRLCEHCGGEVTVAGAGPVITIVCPGCV